MRRILTLALWILTSSSSLTNGHAVVSSSEETVQLEFDHLTSAGLDNNTVMIYKNNNNPPSVTVHIDPSNATAPNCTTTNNLSDAIYMFFDSVNELVQVVAKVLVEELKGLEQYFTQLNQAMRGNGTLCTNGTDVLTNASTKGTTRTSNVCKTPVKGHSAQT